MLFLFWRVTCFKKIKNASLLLHTHLYAILSALHSFVIILVSFWCHFLSVWQTYSLAFFLVQICWKHILLFFIYLKCFYLTFIHERCFPEYNTHCWHGSPTPINIFLWEFSVYSAQSSYRNNIIFFCLLSVWSLYS